METVKEKVACPKCKREIVRIKKVERSEDAAAYCDVYVASCSECDFYAEKNDNMDGLLGSESRNNICGKCKEETATIIRWCEKLVDGIHSWRHVTLSSCENKSCGYFAELREGYK
jgi:hypothetical protein